MLLKIEILEVDLKKSENKLKKKELENNQLRETISKLKQQGLELVPRKELEDAQKEYVDFL